MAGGATTVALLIGLLVSPSISAQTVAPTTATPWHSKGEQQIARQLAADRLPAYDIDHDKVYTLPELIDLAESHNPETRVAWERARARAADLGIARSAFYPTLAAVALASTIRDAALYGEFFHRQTLGVFEPTLHVEYLIFDFGARSGAVDVAKANLISANLQFNDTHRRIIFRVSAAYLRLIDAKGQREAAEISLKNAQAVEDDAQSRLKNGLGTSPDLLEATAAREQADYDLQATLGAEQIAQGELATSMGLPAETAFHTQDVEQLSIPSQMPGSLDQEIDRAFTQRPELLEQIARIRATQAILKESRSAYAPTVSFTGDGGLARAYGQQASYPGQYAEGEVWSVEVEMKWTLFDGRRREKAVASAQAERRAAEADLKSLRDQIDEEVFSAYIDVQTALRQQRAAAALLNASQKSYEAARQSYNSGVRSQLDVISAQKTLAQARSEDVAARAQLLLQTADLAFRTADLIQVQPPRPAP
jgi:outer membrane protein